MEELIIFAIFGAAFAAFYGAASLILWCAYRRNGGKESYRRFINF